MSRNLKKAIRNDKILFINNQASIFIDTIDFRKSECFRILEKPALSTKTGFKAIIDYA